jgi:PAS domain S-box-containing protein
MNTAPDSKDTSSIWLRTLLETIPDLVWLKDPDGVYLSCNPSFERLYGVKAADIIGKTDYDFVDKDLADFFRAHDRKALEAGKPSSNEEWLTFADNGYRGLFETIKTPMHDADGNLIGVLGVARDITDRKRAEEALEKRMVALTLPLDDSGNITFADLFNLGDIQRLQDEFAMATGVASIITHPDGTPITAPSNFCRLCIDIIRKTEKGCANCFKSDAVIGRFSPLGPTIQQCMSGGLWDAGAGISVGGRHIANWLIGQVRDATQTEEHMRNYAREIGADEDSVVEAFREVPSMSREKFGFVAQALFTLANQLSATAYQNVQQARFIADRKRAEEALREAEKSYKELVENAPIGIFRSTAQGRYLMANSRLAEMYGYDSVQELMENVQDIATRLYVDPTERQKLLSSLEQGAVSGKATRRRRKDGSIIWVVTSIRPVRDQAGNLLHYEGFTSDITDRVHMEEVMIQTEKMMSVGGLAAGMAHEINNPLGGVLQNLQNIRRRVSPDLPANAAAALKAGCTLDSIQGYLETRQVFQFLDAAIASGQRAAHIVANMLEFSRQTESRIEPTSLNDMLDKSLELASSDFDLKKRYDFRSISVIRHYEPDLPLVRCSRTEIEQVLLNLLKNAAQAMSLKDYGEERPTITLRTFREDNSIVMEVEDNGPGMEESVRKRVFEPFFTTKHVGEGTGLGLSVSYFIVTNNHKGAFEVDSSPGRGTRFTIRLPLGQASDGVADAF